jgi:hypothetical protein
MLAVAVPEIPEILYWVQCTRQVREHQFQVTDTCYLDQARSPVSGTPDTTGKLAMRYSSTFGLAR